MRHKKSFNHLGRKVGHRKAMLANMASSLILHKRIKTTTTKAKALRVFVEPLITKSKEDTTNSRRLVFRYLKNKEAVSELFREVSTKIENRPGGYTRILKIGNRLGDNSEMAIIELVDYNETLLAAKAEVKQKSARRRRGSKKKSDQADTEPVSAAEASQLVEEKAVTTEKTEEFEKAEEKTESIEAVAGDKETEEKLETTDTKDETEEIEEKVKETKAEKIETTAQESLDKEVQADEENKMAENSGEKGVPDEIEDNTKESDIEDKSEEENIKES